MESFIYKSVVSAVFILFIIFVLIDAPNAASLSKASDDFPGLYKLSDNIEIFTGNTFNSRLYNKNYALLIEFYSSWCGHCQKLAPHWRGFANDVVNWTDVVKIGAIDCAQDENNPTCRQFEIMGYPTVKYFHENYMEAPENIGERMETSNNENFLRENLIAILQKEQSDGRCLQGPVLKKYEGHDRFGLFENVPQPFVFVVVESNDSTLGSEVILDLSHAKDNIVIRRVQGTGQDLFDVVQVPSLVVVMKNTLSVIPITPRVKNRENFILAIKLFLESKGMTLPTPQPYVFNKHLEAQEMRPSEEYIRHIKASGDVVYLADLENVIDYAFKREIAIMKDISGVRFEALIKFLNVLEKYFPFTNNGMKFVHDVKTKIMQKEDNSLTGLEFKSYVEDLEKTHELVLSKEWVGCLGSENSRRGYPCGLWTLFHYLTVRASDLGQSGKNEVLTAMHGYITNFFGCKKCSRHFEEMAAERKMFNVSGADESVMWLWESHNIVNKRLAGDASEDPEFPKIQFPSADRCAQCRLADGGWNRAEVFKYVKYMYAAENVRRRAPESLSSGTQNVTSSSSAASRGASNMFGSLDLSSRSL